MRSDFDFVPPTPAVAFCAVGRSMRERLKHTLLTGPVQASLLVFMQSSKVARAFRPLDEERASAFKDHMVWVCPLDKFQVHPKYLGRHEDDLPSRSADNAKFTLRPG